MTDSRALTPVAARILDAVDRGDRLRRRRATMRATLRALPFASGGLVVMAIVVRLFGISLGASAVLAAIAVLGFGVAMWLTGRGTPVSDVTATTIDRDAGCGGELRSAHWFASRYEIGEWTSHHLDDASRRIDEISWPAVYPPVAAARAWLTASALTLSAVVIALTPGAWFSRSGWTSLSGTRQSVSTVPAIAANVSARIDGLLRAVESGAIPPDAARAGLNDARDALANLDPKTMDALAKAAQDRPVDPDAAELAARADRAAAEAKLPEDVKWSLQDLAAKLANAGKLPTDQVEKASAKPSDATAQATGAAPKSPQQATASMSRVTNADQSSNQMMATDAGGLRGDPSGRGGGPGRRGNAPPIDLAGALKREAVEANADAQGANVLAEMRRKSEQSHSTLAFTRIAPLATYDVSHASPPPATPESLRPLVFQYFVRR